MESHVTTSVGFLYFISATNLLRVLYFWWFRNCISL